MENSFRLGEAVTHLYEIGGRRIGIRWSRTGIGDRLARASGACVGPADAPHNLSVLLGDRDGPVRTKHQLYVQGRLLTVDGDDGRMVRAVARAASALASGAAPGALVLDVVPLSGPDGAVVLVDRALKEELRSLERRLARAGSRVLEVDRVAVDPDPARVRLPDAAALLGIDRPALDADLPVGAGADDLRAVDAPIVRVIFTCGQPPTTRAAEVSALASLLHRDGHGLRTADVARLARLVEQVELAPYAYGDPPSLLDLVTGRTRR